MITIFLEISNHSYLLEHSTCNSETKVFTVLTALVIVKKSTLSALKSQSATLFLNAFTSIRHQKS